MQNQDYYSDQGLVCPSFNAYFSPTTADTAAKVCREFRNLGLVDEDREYEYEQVLEEQEEHNDDFEFVSFQKSADEVFFGDNTRIGPVFPVFNRDLISQRDANDAEDVDAVPSSSSASSDVDELENVPAGSYCVWMPKTTPASSPSHCKKSKSTGTSSSRRWRLRDLLRRSNSEGGKDAFVLLTPSLTSSSSNKKLVAGNDHHHHHPHPNEKLTVTKGKKSFNGDRTKGPNAVSMAHEVFYAKSKEKVGYHKRESYLPYRKDLVGFFASVNAMGRTFPTF